MPNFFLRLQIVYYHNPLLVATCWYHEKNSVASNLSCHAYLFHCTRMFQRSTFYYRNNLAPQFFCMLREVFDATKLSFVEIEYHHKKFTLSQELLVTNILPVAIKFGATKLSFVEIEYCHEKFKLSQ